MSQPKKYTVLKLCPICMWDVKASCKKCDGSGYISHEMSYREKLSDK